MAGVKLKARKEPKLLLNLGCGYRKQEGWIGVDSAPEVKPDVLWDLEKTPWPWETETVDEIVMVHSLEHMGRELNVFTNIIKEVYRVLKMGGVWLVVFPDVFSDMFWGDPTHCRPVTVAMLGLLSQRKNKEFIAQGWANTAYGMHIGVNFETVDLQTMFNPKYGAVAETATAEERAAFNQNLLALRDKHINVVEEWRVLMRKEPLLDNE